MKLGMLLEDSPGYAARLSPELQWQATLALTHRLRDGGFDFILRGEHYLMGTGGVASSIPALARLIPETGEMRLATAITILPLYQPIRLAMEIASLDIMSGGRVICGVGLGFHPVDFAAFGVPLKQRVSRFEENLRLMKLAWGGEEIEFDGKYVQIHGARNMVLPLQRPHPPVWIAAMGDGAFERAGRLGDIAYPGPYVSVQVLARQLGLYRDALDRGGHPHPDVQPLRRNIYIAETTERAEALARSYFSDQQAWFRAMAQGGIAKGFPPDEPPLDRPFDEAARERYVIGDPDACVEQLAALADRFGITHFGFQLPYGTGDVATSLTRERTFEMIALIATGVIPKLKRMFPNR